MACQHPSIRGMTPQSFVKQVWALGSHLEMPLGFLKLNDKSVCVCVRLGVLINTLLIISANYFPLKFFTFTAIFLLQDVSTDLNATPLIIFHMSATRKSLSGKASDSSPLIKSPIKYSYH